MLAACQAKSEVATGLACIDTNLAAVQTAWNAAATD